MHPVQGKTLTLLTTSINRQVWIICSYLYILTETVPLILQISPVSPTQTGQIRYNSSFQYMLHHLWWNRSYLIWLVTVVELAANAIVTLAGVVTGASPVRDDVCVWLLCDLVGVQRSWNEEEVEWFFFKKKVYYILYIPCMYKYDNTAKIRLMCFTYWDNIKLIFRTAKFYSDVKLKWYEFSAVG